MKISKKNKLKAAETLFLIEAMIVSIKIMTGMRETDSIKYDIMLGFSALAFSDFIRAARFRSSDRFVFIKYIGLGGIFSIGTLIISFVSEWTSLILLYFVYGISMIYARIITIPHKRKAVSIVWNLVLIAGAVLISIVPLGDDMTAIVYCLIGLMVIMTAHTLIRLVGISMSQIRFDILKKIFIRSMASEIFFGLLILIISFSLVFKAVEPQIETFFDGLWYCFALVTTIGFGDISAVTALGRVLSVILGIYGIIVVSLITSIIINFYNETKDNGMIHKEDEEEEDAPAETEIGQEDEKAMISKEKEI